MNSFTNPSRLGLLLQAEVDYRAERARREFRSSRRSRLERPHWGSDEASNGRAR